MIRLSVTWILKPLGLEIKLLSDELFEIAEDDEDVKLLMTIPGVGCYTVVLMKSETRDLDTILE